VEGLDTALTALDEARGLRRRHPPPRSARARKIEERLFALRAAARKYNVPVDELKALAGRHAADLGLIEAGAEKLAALESRD
jgi:DNA repair protein RecN (Recombination protein N)